MKRVVIVEDNPLYREALKRLLAEFEIVGEADSGDQVLSLIQATNPDLLILDLSLPKMNGFAVARKLKALNRSLKILVLSIHGSEEFIQAAKMAEVNGYCLKDEKRTDILFAIKAVLEGATYFSPNLSNC